MSSVRFVRTLGIAFVITVAWFGWELTQGTSRSCFSSGHYVGSGAIALGCAFALQVIVELVVWPDQYGRRVQPVTLPYLAVGAFQLAALMICGLVIAGFFDSVASCSA